MRQTILTDPAELRGLRHDPTTITLHWLTAFLVVILWAIGQTVDLVPRGSLRIDYRSVHIVLGAALGLVLLGRLAWRLTRHRSLPPIGSAALLLLARATHWLLYLLLVLAVGFGIANVWVRGDTLFNLMQIPAYRPGDRELVHLIGERHELMANLVFIVAGLHAAAALFHHYILRDLTLRRMLPWTMR